MHFTGAELAIFSNLVAIVAIMAGFAGVRSNNRTQLRLARDAYQRDHLTATYLDVLRGVHLRAAQLDDSFKRPLGQPARTRTEAGYDPTADDAVMFGARLLAYASPEVDVLWIAFAANTTEFDNALIKVRGDYGRPPDEIGDPLIRLQMWQLYQDWLRARRDLRQKVRAELRDPDLSEHDIRDPDALALDLEPADEPPIVPNM